MLKNLKNKFNNDPIFLVSIVGKCTAIFLFALIAALASMDGNDSSDNNQEPFQSATTMTSGSAESKHEKQ